jgi:nucleotide-binding universal stress UspA family protein
MKKIIVAIDFSSCSLHALKYAISIANIIGADIQLVWVDNSYLEEEESHYIEPEKRKDMMIVLNDVIKKYSNKLKEELHYKIKKGKVYQEVSLLAKSNNTDLIIVGTHGSSGFEEYWIGSNAYRIVTHAPCPVITMRQQFPILNKVKKIVIPIDSTPETLQKIDFIAKISKIFKAKLYMLSLYPSGIEAIKRKVMKNEQEAIKVFNENKVKFAKQMVKSDDITRTIIDFANKLNADMIGIMTEQNNKKSHVFLGPDAQLLISNSIIPVLNVRPGNEFIYAT